MTIQLNGTDLAALVEAATVVGVIISMLIAGFVIYLMVRPPRHVRQAKSAASILDDSEAEQLLQLMDRMEARVDVLERLVSNEPAGGFTDGEPRILEPAQESRETRRTK